MEALISHLEKNPPRISVLLISKANPMALALGCRGASDRSPLAFEHDLNRAWPPLVRLPPRKEGSSSESLRDPSSYTWEELATWPTVQHAALLWKEILAWNPTHALDLHETPDRKAQIPFAFAESESDLVVAPKGLAVRICPSKRTLQRALAIQGVPSLAIEVRPGGRPVEARAMEHRNMVLEVLDRFQPKSNFLDPATFPSE